MLPADVYARFMRMEGEEVLFICATDEHGTPAEVSALEAGMDVREYCDMMHQIQKDIYRRFGLSFDYFGRSSSKENAELTQHIYKKLDENGFIEERTVNQVYSVDDGRFLPDRYVIGTCSKCGYTSARGDQCDGCSALLDPEDLQNPRSAISGSTNLEIRQTKHLFIRLDLLAGEIEKWVDSHTGWPRLTTSVAKKWLSEGLQPRCITRDLSWGVPVPREGYEGKVFYVWFDAPIEYIGATQEWANYGAECGLESERDGGCENRDWKSWWFGSEDVYYAQFLAKDNLPFHTIIWPAMTLGTREPWTMASYIKGFNWLTYCGGKFSTSQKRGVFMDQALEIYPPDYWRYYLMATAPESDDSDFNWTMFQTIVNKDLAGNLGNFINRTLKLTASQFGSGGSETCAIPGGGTWGAKEEQLQADVEAALGEYRRCLRDMEFRKAVLALKKLWSLGNLYIDERAPWNLVKSNREEAAQVLRTCINLVRVFASAATPIIPFTSERVADALHLSAAERAITLDRIGDLRALEPGRLFNVPPVLFAKVEEADIRRLAKEYGGSESRPT
jgi:methionyl-tRNA synthetase